MQRPVSRGRLVASCRCARGACTLASSRVGAGLPPAPPGSGGCGVLGHLLPGILDPADELVPGQGRDVLPGIECRRVGDQRLAQVCGKLVHYPTGHSLAAHRATVAVRGPSLFHQLSGTDSRPSSRLSWPPGRKRQRRRPGGPPRAAPSRTGISAGQRPVSPAVVSPVPGLPHGVPGRGVPGRGVPGRGVPGARLPHRGTAGGGMLIPVFTTVLVQAAGGKSLGKLMATVSLPAVVVPILGPVVGGLIVASLDWRWIFYVNVPICARPACCWPCGTCRTRRRKPGLGRAWTCWASRCCRPRWLCSCTGWLT